jgi:hypothetical protein
MDPAAAAPLPSRAIGLLLVLGPLVFWIGAVTPPYRQWMGVPLDEYLRIVAANPLAWRFMHACFAIGSVATACGLAGLAGTVAGRWSAQAASTLFAIATALWLGVVAHRLGATPLAATDLIRAGAIPRAYEASHASAGILFGAHAAMSYLAVAALGLALRGSALPGWVSLLAIAYGLVAVPGLATPVFQPPLMIYIVPFATGVATLSTIHRSHP